MSAFLGREKNKSAMRKYIKLMQKVNKIKEELLKNHGNKTTKDY